MKQFLFASLTAIALTTGAFAAGSDPVPTPSWQPAYDAAVKLIKAGKYDDGITKLKAINVKDSADINNQLGFAYRKSGKWDEAVTFYEAALKIDPNHSGALSYYGEFFVWKGDLAKANTHLARIEKICGNKTCGEYKELAAAITAKKPN
jgi:tetratricopeptide (TPR) repeat protein